MEKDEVKYEQRELFNSVEDGVEPHSNPRDKRIPAKNTEASASAFGWEFQVVTGVILSILHISDLKSVEIEGQTEDIELYFENSEPEYVQVKAVQRDYIEAKDAAKATLAMNTLINTSNLTKGKYSKLLYVANFRNPLSMTEARLAAVWKPEMDSVFSKSYTSLPSTAKKFIDNRISSARKQLRDHDYNDSISHFDMNRLYIATILFGPIENGQLSSVSRQTDSTVLKGVIRDLMQNAKISVRRLTIEHVCQALESYYFANAASPSSNKKHLKITKERLIWRIILELIGNSDSIIDDNLPLSITSEVDDYVKLFIEDQSRDISVINKVYAELADYYPGKDPNKTEAESFINSRWTRFKEDFPLDDDEEVQEFGTKQLIRMILEGQRTVYKIKKAVNMP